MRLIKISRDQSLDMSAFEDQNIPPYAILSHTWGSPDDELSFVDFNKGLKRRTPGYEKLQFCAKQATNNDLTYFWVDTCCINKKDISELQRSILSMFRWYANSAKCYALLSDVSFAKWKQDIPHSRWFTRGWTLQELLAPREVEFFSKEGQMIGTKESLGQYIRQATRIPIEALRGLSLASFTTDQRFSWALRRQTTVPEDKVYCLLGIFDISIPVLYGEGQSKALARLKRELAWQEKLESKDEVSGDGISRSIETDSERPTQPRLGQIVYHPGFGDSPYHWTPRGTVKCTGRQSGCSFCQGED